MNRAAREGDVSHAPADTHGCPTCPHDVSGGARSGSPDVRIEDYPALRVEDWGAHRGCCGANVWVASEGAPGVRINNRAAVRVGDKTVHCGGNGVIVGGARAVFLGEHHRPVTLPGSRWVEVAVVDESGKAIPRQPVRVRRRDGRWYVGVTDRWGFLRVTLLEDTSSVTFDGPTAVTDSTGPAVGD